VLDPERPVVVAASDEDEARAAIGGLRSVGHLEVAGWMRGGGGEKLRLVALEELDALLESGAELIDVREKDERDDGYIPGSTNVPYRLLGEADLPNDRPLVTICETGPRAAIAASILSARGYDARAVANGGIDDWAAAGKPTVEFRRCGG
jgi:hydroxyacylglutathione hydrolase